MQGGVSRAIDAHACSRVMGSSQRPSGRSCLSACLRRLDPGIWTGAAAIFRPHDLALVTNYTIPAKTKMSVGEVPIETFKVRS